MRLLTSPAQNLQRKYDRVQAFIRRWSPDSNTSFMDRFFFLFFLEQMTGFMRCMQASVDKPGVHFLFSFSFGTVDRAHEMHPTVYGLTGVNFLFFCSFGTIDWVHEMHASICGRIWCPFLVFYFLWDGWQASADNLGAWFFPLTYFIFSVAQREIFSVLGRASNYGHSLDPITYHH